MNNAVHIISIKNIPPNAPKLHPQSLFKVRECTSAIIGGALAYKNALKSTFNAINHTQNTLKVNVS